ncbi:formate dehydrogenase subunit gamma [Pseudorhodobacter sp. E13]|uniref:formate dehydrogenase subunit gamma n=1 Tax=Pseudorhodobacter sp. E13 TaxID=2487931 RepID=UPI000F8C924F|nr:formate dehydrogenase subunit gamma [Pseudorhodobacter sp. E13]RUS59239.1 formate dehydrogenase subunit gamma [Pseudorhodobacter sp. E13]
MIPRPFFLLILALLAAPFAPLGVQAQEAPVIDRSATGGASTLEDILARQAQQKLDDSYRSEDVGDPARAAPETAPLGSLGGISQAEDWRALRYNKADVTVSSRSPAADVLMQDGGMAWLAFRAGPLITYGGWLLLGTLALLALFYALRGRIRTDGPLTGRKVLRFPSIERFAHWLLGGSFILLGLTGLFQLFGRKFIIPLVGHEAFAPLAVGGKWVHNNVAWAFMLGLVMVTVFWLVHNIPNKHDLKWLAVGGGLFSKGVHPPAKKFNAGQKIIFWAVLVLGISISVSGLSLLFPFELPMFAGTFDLLNGTGLPQALGFGTLPTALAPHEEMQLAQLWHAIIAFVFIAIILAHIYLGSVGMEGAFDAMGSGEVDEQWAKEHHGLWLDEVKAKAADAKAGANKAATPAE